MLLETAKYLFFQGHTEEKNTCKNWQYARPRSKSDLTWLAVTSSSHVPSILSTTKEPSLLLTVIVGPFPLVEFWKEEMAYL